MRFVFGSGFLCHLCQLHLQKLCCLHNPEIAQLLKLCLLIFQNISSCRGAARQEPKNQHSLGEKIAQACLPCLPLFASLHPPLKSDQNSISSSYLWGYLGDIFLGYLFYIWGISGGYMMYILEISGGCILVDKLGISR